MLRSDFPGQGDFSKEDELGNPRPNKCKERGEKPRAPVPTRGRRLSVSNSTRKG